MILIFIKVSWQSLWVVVHSPILQIGNREAWSRSLDREAPRIRLIWTQARVFLLFLAKFGHQWLRYRLYSQADDCGERLFQKIRLLAVTLYDFMNIVCLLHTFSLLHMLIYSQISLFSQSSTVYGSLLFQTFSAAGLLCQSQTSLAACMDNNSLVVAQASPLQWPPLADMAQWVQCFQHIGLAALEVCDLLPDQDQTHVPCATGGFFTRPTWEAWPFSFSNLVLR